MNKMIKYGVAFAAGLFALNSYALTVETPAKGKQELPDNPKRIVVLDLASADNLAALGKQNLVVGIADGKFFPSYINDTYGSAKYVKVGALNNPDLEAIAKLKPDLIIVQNRQAKFLEQLKEIAPIYDASLDDGNQYASIKANLLNVGKIANASAKADELLKTLDEKIAALNVLSKGKTAMIIQTNDRKIMGFGPNSRYSLVTTTLGFKADGQAAQATGRHGVEFSYEYIKEVNPSYIFVVDRSAAIGDTTKQAAAQTLNNPLVKDTTAAKNNAIVYLDSKVWYLAFGGYTATTIAINEITQGIKNAK
ncbi:siderophore ABC transporter substrate-binding protein [Psittacicella gerlachiana]|uniref:Fe/B12 periplasmic-binding domain-containing protein n=1 Tax=Psittacicella gerlachiana TaxID=2028574 RepID=A0A3A1YI92_9GAMM|nr:siderophore ABC transporter substrate-binding protein [Psittacicella gerlachiana]RIY37166.1 hypothetical protein CKF59_01965 [Psittacicella gerlachiana]